MVVASSCLAFRALITQAPNLKKVSSSKLDKFTLFILPSSAETWKIVTKKVSQFVFAKADILSEKNPYFAKHLFAKQDLITRARLRGQDFATGKNFSFNQGHTECFAFFLGKVIL